MPEVRKDRPTRWISVAAVILVIAGLAFVAGRADRSSSTDALPAGPTVSTTVAPTTKATTGGTMFTSVVTVPPKDPVLIGDVPDLFRTAKGLDIDGYLLSVTQVRPGAVVAFGFETQGLTRGFPRLVATAKTNDHGAWTSSVLNIDGAAPPVSCAHETSSPDLVDGTGILVANCLLDGFNGGSKIIIIGAPPGEASRVLLITFCGVTNAAIDGNALVLHSADPSRSAADPQAHPDLRLHWKSDHFVADDPPTYWKYCSETAGF